MLENDLHFTDRSPLAVELEDLILEHPDFEGSFEKASQALFCVIVTATKMYSETLLEVMRGRVSEGEKIILEEAVDRLVMEDPSLLEDANLAFRTAVASTMNSVSLNLLSE